MPPAILFPLQDTPTMAEGITFAWVAWTLFTGGAVGYLVRTITCPTHGGFLLVIPVSGYRVQLGFLGALLAGVAGASVTVFIDLTLLHGVLSGLGDGTRTALEIYLRLMGLGVLAGYGAPIVLARMAGAPAPAASHAPVPPRRAPSPAPRSVEPADEAVSGPFEPSADDSHLRSTPIDALEAEVLLMDPESADGFYNRARMKQLHRRASFAQHRMQAFTVASIFDDLRAMVHHDRAMAGVVTGSAEFEDLREEAGFRAALEPASGSA
ncbi:MAG: hypothetical protein E2O39_11005 [Planctomycetota bacterium]|nr:MAG: hypothetical protein E2O39_11005 [Planctomycetota bacterium]